MATSLINKNFIKIFQNKILIARNYDRLSILSKNGNQLKYSLSRQISCAATRSLANGHITRCLYQAKHSLPSTCSQRPYSSTTELEEEDELDSLFKWIDVEVKGHDPAVLNSYEMFVSMAAQELDVNIVDILTPPKVIEKYTLLKSIHIYKKHRVQYETRTHYRLIKIKHITGSTADTFLEYIQRNLPEGVAMKVTKCKLENFPKHIEENIASRISPPEGHTDATNAEKPATA